VKITSTAELQEKMDSKQRMVVVDCREEEEYGVSHIPGAVHLPFKASDSKVVEVLRREVGEAADTEVICYCSVGYRSSVLARRLDSLETEPPLAVRPSNLEGSIFTWAAEGRQVGSPLWNSRNQHFPVTVGWGGGAPLQQALGHPGPPWGPLEVASGRGE